MARSCQNSPGPQTNTLKMYIYISKLVILLRKVEIFTVHISEAGEEYTEKIEVDANKRTQLFQVPAHPGVDRSDVLHDFKQVRFANILLNSFLLSALDLQNYLSLFYINALLTGYETT